VRRDEKNEAECLLLFTPYDSSLPPHASRGCLGNGIRLAESLCSTKLAGCGNTISGQLNFEGLHVCLRRAQSSGTSLVYLVYLVYLVDLVCFVYLVSLV